MGRLGLGDRIVEEDKELFKGGLVHDVDLAQLDNEEVEDAAPGGHAAEFLPRRVDLLLRLSCHLQLSAHFTCRLLCLLQDVNQLLVIHEAPFDGVEFSEKAVLQILHGSLGSVSLPPQG